MRLAGRKLVKRHGDFLFSFVVCMRFFLDASKSGGKHISIIEQASVIVPFAVQDPLSGVVDQLLKTAVEEFWLFAFDLNRIDSDAAI